MSKFKDIAIDKMNEEKHMEQDEFVHMETERLLRQQAMVHFKQDCCGLPLCASCRATVLLDNNFNIEKSEVFINAQPEGTKVYLSDKPCFDCNSTPCQKHK